VDVGANIGIFSTAFAAAGFSEVHAFEPIPATFARLEENVEFNCFGSRVKLNAQGLGDQERVAEMQYDQGNPAEAHIVTEATPGACPIKITTLDRYAELNQIHRIDFLKIDTEGYETAVLRGAETLLREKRVSLILLEWYPELLIRAGSGPDELWRTIMDAGYLMYLNFSAGKTDTPVTFDELKSMPWSNLIAVPAEDVA
jgi:FkbM family methyltransferase